MQHCLDRYLTGSIVQKQQSSCVKCGPDNTGRTSCLSCSRPTNGVSPLPAGNSSVLPVARQRSERLGAVCVTELWAKKLTHQLGSSLNRIWWLTSQGDKTTRTWIFCLFSRWLFPSSDFSFAWLGRSDGCVICLYVMCVCGCNLCNPQQWNQHPRFGSPPRCAAYASWAASNADTCSL